MLYPQQNDKRNALDLSGFWDFKLDPEEVGESDDWFNGLDAPRTIAVPASWNELFQDTRDYLDVAWYAREFYVPQSWQGQKVYLRIGSANYAARVWVNGQFVGEHHGGDLPFAFDVTDEIAWNAPNSVAIEVEGKLTPTIARETFHSPQAVDRYILDLARVYFASAKQGMSPEEVAFALQRPVGIVKQYLTLIEEFGLDEQQVVDRAGAQAAGYGGGIHPTAAEEARPSERREQEPVIG